MESPAGTSVPEHEGWDMDVMVQYQGCFLIPDANVIGSNITSGKRTKMSWLASRLAGHCAQLTFLLLGKCLVVAAEFLC